MMKPLGMFVTVLCVFFFLAGESFADERKPLVQQGKTHVYQRVVTHPRAKLYESFEEDAKEIRGIPTFSVLYIYDRKGNRLEVGAGANKADGWVDKALVTEWPQAITMLFTDRTGRDPVLFFKSHESLQETCKAENVQSKIESYLASIKESSGKIPDSLPILASEPLETQVAEKNFYLLPVLNIDNQFQDVNLIEVASINPGTGEENGENAASSPKDRDFRIGFAFVIDTTISMGPYIKQTVNLLRHLYNSLEKSKYANNMAFAVVAFRSSLAKTPELEYTARVICDFTVVKDRAVLEKAIQGLQEATVSTHDINEDSFAGIREAAEKLSWEKFGSRVMLMVSDAGPLGADDPNSLTRLSPDALADYLRERKIYLTAVHVKGDKNKKNHAYAAKSYRELTMQSDNQASYIPIEARSGESGARDFRKAADMLAKSYARLLNATAEGKFLPSPQKKSVKKALTPEEEAQRIAETTGYAMQLQFFGNAQKSTAPEVVRAWIADADLAKMEQLSGSAPILAVEPAVLLTKAQLSNLYTQLKILLQASEEAFLNGEADLFSQIRFAAAQLSRDPKQYELNPERSLVENNFLDEILLDLPYKSQITGMTQQDWESMSTGARQSFISRLKSLLARYEEYDRDSTHWEGFGSTNPNDWYYRVPLKMLP